VNASQDILIDLFERIESFFKRLEYYTGLKPSEAMTDMMAKIMVEVLSIMAIVTVEIKQKRRSQFVTRSPALLRLDPIFSRKILKEATRKERH
jgi:hypothetical protein